MKIVIECSCQKSYEFDIEPVNGRIPGSVFCPTCGADGTEYANWVIEETLGAQQEAKPRIGLKRATEADPIADTAQPSGTTDDGAPGLPKFCFIHKDQPVEVFCLTCKKPICLKCMKQTGYFCSIYCRSRAEQAGMEIPEYAGQERVVRAREYKRVTQMGTALLLALLALFIAYEWYEVSGQKPKLEFSMPATGGGRLQSAQFVSDHELLLVGADKVSVYDFQKDQPVWSKSLTSYRPPQPPALPQVAQAEQSGDEAKLTKLDPAAMKKLAEQMAEYEDYFTPNTTVRVAGDGIWVTMGRNIVCFDRATGAEKTKTQVDGRIQEMTFGDDAMIVVSSKGAYNRIFTRIELPSGTQQTEQDFLPEPPRRAATFDPDAPVSSDPYVPEEQHEFVAAGTNVARLDVKLVEKKLVTVDTMKPVQQNKQEFENLQVTQSREYAEDVLNEMKRMRGGATARVDRSRYAATIQRVFGNDVAPWTDEVTGPPVLFALKTVDVLVAGNVMYVLNKSNQKLWQSTLSYPVAVQFRSQRTSWGYAARESATAPCIERGDTLYFFDQGVLTAFDTKSGTARWRMPSVGISKIQFDDKGMLYVTTTSASPESIQYSEQVNLSDKVEPIILKVDPANGKVLWRVEKIGDDCYLSGKYVYFTKTRAPSGLIALTSHTVAPTNFRVYRFNPRNGKQVWEYYREGSPSSLDFHDNAILLQFPDRIEVLKFLALY
jgi:outer membrane protein assembly factor BamB